MECLGSRQNGVDQHWRFGSNWSDGDAGHGDLLIDATDAWCWCACRLKSISSLPLRLRLPAPTM